MMTPSDENELAQAIAAATGPLAVQGGGTRGLQTGGDGLSVAGMSGITLYEPGALTMVAQAGTPVADVQAALAAENQSLAFEPMDHRALLGRTGTPTIGGVFAANVSGPRRLAVGAARDFLLGVRFVDGAGTVVKNGGRVMKNVTGYDLVKLMAGSHGQLGVLSEVSFKVLPRPETVQTLVLHGLSDTAAIAAMTTAMRSPFEVSGAAHIPHADGGPATYLRIEGFADSVAYRMGKIAGGAGGADSSTLDEAASNTLWEGLRDCTAWAQSAGDVWRVSCKPSDAATLAARAGADAWWFDWAGGLIWLNTPAGHDLRGALAGFDGHATLVRGAPDQGVFHPEAPGVARLTEALRARFDPKGLFTPRPTPVLAGA